jgi:hypothetical protein
MQTIEKWWKLTWTLRSGVQIKLWVQGKPEDLTPLDSLVTMEGIVAEGLIRKKTVVIDPNEVAAQEIEADPQIVYEVEDDTRKEPSNG